MKLKHTNGFVTAAAIGAFLSFSSVGWSQVGSKDDAAGAANSNTNAPSNSNSVDMMDSDEAVTATGYCTGGTTASTTKTKVACEASGGTWKEGTTGHTDPLNRNEPTNTGNPTEMDPAVPGTTPEN